MFVIIVGGGKTGSYLARLLLAGNHQVRVVEWRLEVVEKLQKEIPGDAIIRGDGADPRVLDRAGIRVTDVLAAVTGDDENNLVVSTLARFEFGVRRIIARVNDPRNAWLFTADMGVDVPVNQADLTSHLIAEEMSLGEMMTLLKLRQGQFSLVEEKVDPTSPAAGKAVRDIGLPRGCTVVAVIRQGDLLSPGGDLVLQPADEVLVVARVEQLEYLAQLLGPGKTGGT